jgi:hypothetical protein
MLFWDPGTPAALHLINIIDIKRLLLVPFWDISLFSPIKNYLTVEKRWTYSQVRAQARRTIIPQSMKQDIVFCCGPFLSGLLLLFKVMLHLPW